MKNLNKLMKSLLDEQKKHTASRFNYTIPEAWNMFGFSQGKKTKTKEIIVNPYDFYSFQIQKIIESGPIEITTSNNWLNESIIYYHLIETCGAWDHDRDGNIEYDNLYDLRDTGTFLKSIVLLPLYKRMGMNTIVIDMPISTMCKKEPQSFIDYRKIDERLRDTMIDIDANTQCHAFIEAAKHLGFKVMWSCDMSSVGIDNLNIRKHPDWFYWMNEDYVSTYHTPNAPLLPEHMEPSTDVLDMFYKSDDVIQHISQFKKAPINNKKKKLAVAPIISDLINHHAVLSKIVVPYRFYTDHIYLTQDILRCDLNPGKHPNKGLWNYLNDTLQEFIHEFSLDGIYLKKVYLLPNQFVTQFIKTVHDMHESKVIMIEEYDMKKALEWKEAGCDCINGPSAYIEHNTQQHQLHDYAYHTKEQACKLLATSEYMDTPRLISFENGSILSNLLHSLNLFLPNSIPMYMSGMECGDPQPLHLSHFSDASYLQSVSKEDMRYLKQGKIDATYFEYRNPIMYSLPKLMERLTRLRFEYTKALHEYDSCIPVWFQSPSDDAIGFAYTLQNKALLIIANTNLSNGWQIEAQTQMVFHKLPFSITHIHQIFSTDDPYTYDIPLDDHQRISLYYHPGEIKFFELG